MHDKVVKRSQRGRFVGLVSADHMHEKEPALHHASRRPPSLPGLEDLWDLTKPEDIRVCIDPEDIWVLQIPPNQNAAGSSPKSITSGWPPNRKAYGSSPNPIASSFPQGTPSYSWLPHCNLSAQSRHFSSESIPPTRSTTVATTCRRCVNGEPMAGGRSDKGKATAQHRRRSKCLSGVLVPAPHITIIATMSHRCVRDECMMGDIGRRRSHGGTWRGGM